MNQIVNLNPILGTQHSGACFSPDQKYRYALWRNWDFNRPKAAFIGLNPSRANQAKNDNTINKVIAQAKFNGYGGIVMMNLFGFITPYPKELFACQDPIGANDHYLKQVSECVKDVVFCWGTFKQAKERCRTVIEMFPGALALIMNQDGSPRHPLFVKGKTQFIPFTIQ